MTISVWLQNLTWEEIKEKIKGDIDGLASDIASKVLGKEVRN